MNRPRFHPGDLVHIRSHGRGTVWRVLEEDTTPHDPEPAYRLQRVERRRDAHRNERYAYEKDLLRVTTFSGGSPTTPVKAERVQK
jgi:hypothetical protein